MSISHVKRIDCRTIIDKEEVHMDMRFTGNKPINTRLGYAEKRLVHIPMK